MSSGKAGGFAVAGSSKGSDRNRAFAAHHPWVCFVTRGTASAGPRKSAPKEPGVSPLFSQTVPLTEKSARFTDTEGLEALNTAGQETGGTRYVAGGKCTLAPAMPALATTSPAKPEGRPSQLSNCNCHPAAGPGILPGFNRRRPFGPDTGPQQPRPANVHARPHRRRQPERGARASQFEKQDRVALLSPARKELRTTSSVCRRDIPLRTSPRAPSPLCGHGRSAWGPERQESTGAAAFAARRSDP